jgi:hypothetical protein
MTNQTSKLPTSFAMTVRSIVSKIHIKKDSLEIAGTVVDLRGAPVLNVDDQLTRVLYAKLYAMLPAGDRAAQERSPASDPVHELEAIARASLGGVDWSWRVCDRSEAGSVLASRSGRLVQLDAGSWLRDSLHPEAIGILSTKLESSNGWTTLRFLMDGWQRGGSELRFYFNLCPAGVAPLAQTVLRDLLRFRIPFSFKVPSTSAGFRRPDAAVLYVERRTLHLVWQIIAKHYRSLADVARTCIPGFALAVGPGLGFAESPPSGYSFGWSRMQLVAAGIVTSVAASTRPTSRLLTARIGQAFLDGGYDLEDTYRNPHSQFPYRSIIGSQYQL